jgi:bacterioferritin
LTGSRHARALTEGGDSKLRREASGSAARTPGAPRPDEVRMKGVKEVIELLNEVLAGELVAINQYFLHGRMCDNWGYKKIGAFVRKESIDEMKHADRLISRILFLDGLPNLQRLDKLSIGQTVPEQFRADLGLEYKAVKLLNDGIALCRDKADNATEALLTEILVSEEEHIDWLEMQIRLIEHLGEAAYLAEQM